MVRVGICLSASYVRTTASRKHSSRGSGPIICDRPSVKSLHTAFASPEKAKSGLRVIILGLLVIIDHSERRDAPGDSERVSFFYDIRHTVAYFGSTVERRDRRHRQPGFVHVCRGERGPLNVITRFASRGRLRVE